MNKLSDEYDELPHHLKVEALQVWGSYLQVTGTIKERPAAFKQYLWRSQETGTLFDCLAFQFNKQLAAHFLNHRERSHYDYHRPEVKAYYRPAFTGPTTLEFRAVWLPDRDSYNRDALTIIVLWDFNWPTADQNL